MSKRLNAKQYARAWGRAGPWREVFIHSLDIALIKYTRTDDIDRTTVVSDESVADETNALSFCHNIRGMAELNVKAVKAA